MAVSLPRRPPLPGVQARPRQLLRPRTGYAEIMTRKHVTVLLLILAAVPALLLGVRFLMPPTGQGSPASVEHFLDGHWGFPLEPQGMPPDHFSLAEASLDAASCAQCHAQQHEDWQTSRHSHTMNAGIRWQFHVFSQAESNTCMNCHAPLAEQKALVAQELGWPNAPQAEAPDHIAPDLHRQGLTCAACHVRGHERFGPESRVGLRGDEDGLPHDGFSPQPAFSDSRFCAACHQFPEDGPRLNGKLRQDTYNEWRRSEFAARGVNCQTCHMPERRHLWRGISDAGMVRRAVAVDLAGDAAGDGRMDLYLSIANVGAGHHFPAYMVPRVDVRLLLLDPDDRVRAELLRHVIQWRSSVDLTTEHFDTRLPSGESVDLTARARVPEDPQGWSLVLTMDVAPKEHYERMYRDMLGRAGEWDSMTVDLLRVAMAEAARTRYRAIEERVPLGPSVRLSLRETGFPAVDLEP